MRLDEARALFPRVPGYLNACTLGLPPAPVTAAMTEALAQWQRGQACAASYDEAVQESRSAFAALVGAEVDQVAVGSQVSVFSAMVASSLPDGAEVVCVEGDFTSMVFPFLVQADRGVRVRQVPLAGLAEAITPGTDLVSFSLAQSASGELADLAAVRSAAARVGALTYLDLTQAAGWLPVRADDADITVTSAYKWLCSPRGSAFLTVAPSVLPRLRPVAAGWYAGEEVWGSCYGPGMHLARGARRLDVSPAWLVWVGTVPALELFASLDADQLRAWGSDLADRLRAALDLAPQGRPVVALDDPDGMRQAALERAGFAVSARAGKVRLAFHLWNDEHDVEAAVAVLKPLGAAALAAR